MERPIGSPELISIIHNVEEMGGEFVDLPSGSILEQTFVVFENGYGASIVRNRFKTSLGSYDSGLFEIGVIKLDETAKQGWHLNYDTPVANDVIENLEVEEIPDILKKISELEAD